MESPSRRRWYTFLRTIHPGLKITHVSGLYSHMNCQSPWGSKEVEPEEVGGWVVGLGMGVGIGENG
jgi:hypothetical protein